MSMTIQQEAVWKKLQAFELDAPDSSLTFSMRLARENAWSKAYTQRAIEEYKRFLFMCCVSDHPVSPSHVVDEVWHFHLTYTKSYWIDLCQNTLGKSIHHTPTKGGNSERQKHNNQYIGTKDLYQQLFGHKAPRDIWFDDKRQMAEFHFQKVNMHRNWVIPKPLWLRNAKPAAAISIGLSLFCIYAANMSTGLWVMLALFAIFIVLVIIVNSDNSSSRPKKRRRKSTTNSSTSNSSCSASFGISSGSSNSSSSSSSNSSSSSSISGGGGSSGGAGSSGSWSSCSSSSCSSCSGCGGCG